MEASVTLGRTRAVRRHPSVLAGLIMVIIVIVVAVAAPVLAPHAPQESQLSQALLPPFWYADGTLTHPLGTDYLGRDLLSRLMFGARTSLIVGVCAVLVAGTIGTVLGLLAGFFGGLLDDLIMRLIDTQLAFPAVLLAIAIMAVIGQSIFNMVMVLGFVTWITYARVVRASTLAVKEQEFVLGARAIGATNYRILRRHILPNVLTPLTVIATVNVSAMILAEAALSYLGIGIQPPTPSWGSMLNEGRAYYNIAWWIAVLPGLAIAFTVFGINLLGDGLRNWQHS